jgi:hypothetical protein
MKTDRKTSQSSPVGATASPTIMLLTAREAAGLLKVSLSWLAKVRTCGDGPRTSRSRPGPAAA